MSCETARPALSPDRALSASTKGSGLGWHYWPAGPHKDSCTPRQATRPASEETFGFPIRACVLSLRISLMNPTPCITILSRR